ncbi:MAG: UDP-N-acetylglucosamine 2-epimerase (hydrolyzing) [Phycisphaeraceae bacterium]|nr:MAG: UDP-N-acetylglucosamine 2-epimerase (hydrolyzing) [Phycisphaeraceae bacterium]
MTAPRCIAVVTTGRADYGLFVPVLEAAAACDALDLSLYVTGAHLAGGHGPSFDRIIADGWPITASVPIPSGDHPGAMGEAIAEGVNGFTGALITHEPDAVLVLGDRFETIAAALAASACAVPIAHLHGGEITAGAVDNQFRYAITALANLHLVATERARARLIAMGESRDSVKRTGAPGLDHLTGFKPMPRAEFNASTGMTGEGVFLLVTLHPTTLDDTDPAAQARELLAAFDKTGAPCLITAANQDPGGGAINAVLRAAARDRGWVFADALGPGVYHSAMHHAAAMVGNSSSGIIEAATLGLPVVNIGERQAGRERSGNVIDCGHGADEIGDAIGQALAMGRREYANLYGDGHAGPRIVDALAAMPLGAPFLRKRFEPPGL